MVIACGVVGVVGVEHPLSGDDVVDQEVVADKGAKGVQGRTGLPAILVEPEIQKRIVGKNGKRYSIYSSVTSFPPESRVMPQHVLSIIADFRWKINLYFRYCKIFRQFLPSKKTGGKYFQQKNAPGFAEQYGGSAGWRAEPGEVGLTPILPGGRDRLSGFAYPSFAAHCENTPRKKMTGVLRGLAKPPERPLVTLGRAKVTSRLGAIPQPLV